MEGGVASTRDMPITFFEKLGVFNARRKFKAAVLTAIGLGYELDSELLQKMSATMPGMRRALAVFLEEKAQAKWDKLNAFEVDAPEGKWDGGKFFATFPYPYMNGMLHLGHGFSLTKAEFACAYQRLQGKKVLFPFSFYCTGMPIQAAANRIKMEMASGKTRSAEGEKPTQHEILQIGRAHV